MRLLKWLIPSVLAALLLGGIWLFFCAIPAAREAARLCTCECRVNQLQLALQNYHTANGHFPPAFVRGPDGTPWHSWRVLILPFFNHQSVYDEYRFDEPWNGPNNRLLADKIRLEAFQCGSGPDYLKTHNTNYVAIVGKDTAFPGSEATALSDILDGSENTILLAEIANSDIHWMEPRDLDAATMSYRLNHPSEPSISSPHPAGPTVVFADAIRGYRLRPPLSVDTLKALTTIAGGEPVRRQDLIHWDSSSGDYLRE